MKVFKFKDPANECVWVSAKEIAFLNVTSATNISVKFLGIGDDLAFDNINVSTVSGKSGEVAGVLAGLVHDKKPGFVDVLALDSVSGISRLTPA
jgi:hypothetical protein